MDITRLYEARFGRDEDRTREELWQEIAAWLVREGHVHSDEVVLDVGAGRCELINALPGRQRFALDQSHAVTRWAGPGVQAVVADAVDLPQLELPPLDAVIASNVFEHVRDKQTLLRVVKAIHDCLAPGGRLLILQPNLRLVGGEYWDFLDHHIPLTDRSMRELLELIGFELEEVRSRFLPYTTKSLLPQHKLLVRAYLRFRPAQWLLGRQMFIRAKRVR